jgi:hypothetical protein
VLLLVLAVAGSMLTGCASGKKVVLAVGLPPKVAPTQLAVGAETFQIQREQKAETAFAKAGKASLVAEGRVYTVRLNTAVQASLQVGAFKSGIDARASKVQTDILTELGIRRPQRASLPGGITVYHGTLPAQTLDVYFPPSGRYYDLLVAQETFADAHAVFADIISYQGDGS